jgi:hypothetical protein
VHTSKGTAVSSVAGKLTGLAGKLMGLGKTVKPTNNQTSKQTINRTIILGKVLV